MVLLKNVLLVKNKKQIILKNLNLDTLKRIMSQNEHNTVILDCANGRFLFYDYKTKGSNKYDLYDVDILNKSDEIFEKILLFKCDESDIKNKIYLAENFRRDCALSILKNQNEKQQQYDTTKKEKLEDINKTTAIDSMDLLIKSEQQSQLHEMNYNKTILESDDNESNRSTFDDIIKLDDESLLADSELEDEEIDDNMHQQQILCDIKEKNHYSESIINSKTNISIEDKLLESNNSCLLSSSEKFVIEKITTDLSCRFSSFEQHMNERFDVMEKHINGRLDAIERNVNRRLSNMENNINLIYQRQSLQSLLLLLDSMYLITSDRLETRRFCANESNFMLKFFNFISKQLIIHYTERWSMYPDISKKLSLKPKSIEINLLGFGFMEKTISKNKICTIQSPTSLFVHNTNNYRSSYVSQCRKIYDKPLSHVLVFEGTTSPVYFNNKLLKDIDLLSSSISTDKKILSMKILLRKLLQLESIIFFLSFYYEIELSQFFSGLICFPFYHNSHIDTNLMLKNIMSSEFSQVIPLLFRLYSIDQFILTY